MGIGLTRRELLRSAAIAGAGLAASTIPARLFASPVSRRPDTWDRLVILMFGGGTRTSESIGDPKGTHIPFLKTRLIPRGTLYTNVYDRGMVVHPSSCASVVCGEYEWTSGDWTVPLVTPTVFERFRKATDAPVEKAWAFIYAPIYNGLAASAHPGFGARYGAAVFRPPVVPRTAREAADREIETRSRGVSDVERRTDIVAQAGRAIRSASELRCDDAPTEPTRAFMRRFFADWQRDRRRPFSHDRYILDGALAAAREFHPDVLFLGFGEIDVAHYGVWSRYVNAIQYTDRFVFELIDALEADPYYAGRTAYLVTPDHGRELERPGGDGWVHHGNFYTGENIDQGCRHIWALAIGPGIAPGRVVDADCEHTSMLARLAPSAAPPLGKALR